MKAKKLSEMTHAQARVTIAKDVLKHLKSYRVKQGVYCRGSAPRSFNPPGKDQAQKHLKVLEKSCEVCALGSMMLSHIRTFNNFKIQEAQYSLLPGEGENPRNRHQKYPE